MSEQIKSDIDIFVANKAKELRKKAKISQLTLGNAIGLSHAFIGQVEDPNHKSRYNVMHINKIAKVLKCSPKDLLPPEPM